MTDFHTSPTPDGAVIVPARALDADGDGQPDYADEITVADRVSLLQRIPMWVRGVLYVGYALTGAILLYLMDKGIVGAAELKLYLAVGIALGITATGNLTR